MYTMHNVLKGQKASPPPIVIFNLEDKDPAKQPPCPNCGATDKNKNSRWWEIIQPDVEMWIVKCKFCHKTFRATG